MNKIIYNTILLLMISGSVLSQRNIDSLRRLYNDELMYRQGNSFRVGSERFSFNQLENEFQISDVGLGVYRQAKNSRTIRMILSGLSIISGVAALAYIGRDINTTYTLMGSSFLLSIGSGYYLKQYNERLDKAIWQRNKDLLFAR